MAEQIRQYCRDHLAHYKVPRYVRFVDAFPQTVTGKIQKFKIREQMINDLESPGARNRLIRALAVRSWTVLPENKASADIQ